MLRENFAAIVSHELKSPLSAVQQNLFVLSHQLAPAITEDQQERLERMKVRIGDLIGMVDTWLRGVTVDLSAIRDWFGVVSVSTLVAKAVESVQPRATSKNIAIVVDEHGESVFGDEGTLTEALTNIIGNAVKYSHEGGTVTVSTRRLDEDVRIDVSDSGVGIPEEDQARIFDDFYRADTGTIRVGGAGLGLAISRRIIAVHGGSVSVESKAGTGTTFTVLLPTKETSVPQPDELASENSET
jgi:signal transduction histidine kinase